MKMNVKYLLLGVVFALTACNQPPPVQSSVYQETVEVATPVSVHTPIEQGDDSDIDASDVALGVATGVVVGAVAKSAYDKRKVNKKQSVVVNKYYSKPVRSYTKQRSRSKRK